MNFFSESLQAFAVSVELTSLLRQVLLLSTVQARRSMYTCRMRKISNSSYTRPSKLSAVQRFLVHTFFSICITATNLRESNMPQTSATQKCFSARPFSATHFSAVFPQTAWVFTTPLDDSAIHVSGQNHFKLCLHTIEHYPEFFRISNVITSTGLVPNTPTRIITLTPSLPLHPP